MSNYMSLMLARQRKFPHVKKQGYKASDKPVMFTSTHSHYSLKLGAIVSFDLRFRFARRSSVRT